ncbi:MAG TPA: hypothetical protein VKB96_02485 [Gammaproteobacteria bacterium]|nr:hypothetical protein [Gammaproteobacteria bacterium]
MSPPHLARRKVLSTVLSWRRQAEREVRALAVVPEAPFAQARVERGQVFKQPVVAKSATHASCMVRLNLST